MSELAERSRQIAAKAVFSADGHHVKTFDADSLSQLIEQALLAERRLARLEDAEIAANERVEEIAPSDHAYNMAIKHVVQALRAAAEKEVGTK